MLDLRSFLVASLVASCLAGTTERQLAVSVQEFCSDLGGLEFFLETSGTAWRGANNIIDVGNGVSCHCAKTSPLRIECVAAYQLVPLLPYGTIRNRNYADFVAFEGNYVKKTVGWCERWQDLLLDDYCEEVEYCDGGLSYCSCQGINGCGECSVCPVPNYIAVDCSSRTSLAHNYSVSCENFSPSAYLVRRCCFT